MAQTSSWEDYHDAVRAMREQTGVIITAFLPEGLPTDEGRRMLSSTARAFMREVGNEALCLAADGPGRTADVVRELAAELDVEAVVTGARLGKLSSQRAGIHALLKNDKLRYFAAADQDGDHFANELVNLVRAARRTESLTGEHRIMALGRRISLHRAMGFARGELELLADRVLMDALNYHASKSGRPLRLEFALTMDEAPDFHSGYKLFTRQSALDVFAAPPEMAGCSDECYYRHAVEAVICTEAIIAGAVLVSVNRSTFDEQPVSGFGQLNRRRLVADKIVWPSRRLGIPPEFVAQWVDNHLPRSLLGTLIPDGREELIAIRDLIRADFGLPPGGGEVLRPEFI